MRLVYFLIPLIISPFFNLYAQQSKEYYINTIAFYNLENLFDTENDPLTFDDDRTPAGKDLWTEEKYNSKLRNISNVISEIGNDLTGNPPIIIGVCEIENRKVLEDLIAQKSLAPYNYGIIHIDSPDIRGIDVALIYRKEFFAPIYYKNFELPLYDNDDTSIRIFTRDQLLVSGIMDGEKFHLIINHWPSRRGGEAQSRSKRIKAAQLNRGIIDSLFSVNPYAKIITMGDFNDDPNNLSVKKYLRTSDNNDMTTMKTLFNPMEKLYSNGYGSLAWRDGWNLFDQIIISSEMLKKDFSSYRFYKAGIYNKSYLKQREGQYNKYPHRFNTYSQEGYSDHFPVYIYLIKKKEE